jgi:hypothetical protein
MSDRKSDGKTSGVLWGLVALNVILLLIFLWQGGANHTATAQYRHAPDYLLIPGEISGAPTEVVYVLDTTNGGLGAVTYDDGTKTLQLMPAINLNTVFSAGISGKLK